MPGSLRQWPTRINLIPTWPNPIVIAMGYLLEAMTVEITLTETECEHQWIVSDVKSIKNIWQARFTKKHVLSQKESVTKGPKNNNNIYNFFLSLSSSSESSSSESESLLESSVLPEIRDYRQYTWSSFDLHISNWYLPYRPPWKCSRTRWCEEQEGYWGDSWKYSRQGTSGQAGKSNCNGK